MPDPLYYCYLHFTGNHITEDNIIWMRFAQLVRGREMESEPRQSVSCIEL